MVEILICKKHVEVRIVANDPVEISDHISNAGTIQTIFWIGINISDNVVHCSKVAQMTYRCIHLRKVYLCPGCGQDKLKLRFGHPQEQFHEDPTFVIADSRDVCRVSLNRARHNCHGFASVIECLLFLSFFRMHTDEVVDGGHFKSRRYSKKTVVLFNFIKRKEKEKKKSFFFRIIFHMSSQDQVQGQSATAQTTTDALLPSQQEDEMQGLGTEIAHLPDAMTAALDGESLPVPALEEQEKQAGEDYRFAEALGMGTGISEEERAIFTRIPVAEARREEFLPFSQDQVQIGIDENHFVGRYSKQLYVNAIKLSWPATLFQANQKLVWLPTQPVAKPIPAVAADVPRVSMILAAGDHISVWDDKKNGIWAISSIVLNNNQRGGKSKNYISLSLIPAEAKGDWLGMYEFGKSYLPSEDLTRPGSTPDFARRLVTSPRNISMLWRGLGFPLDLEMFVAVRAYVSTCIEVARSKESKRRQKKSETGAAAAAPKAAAGVTTRSKRVIDEVSDMVWEDASVTWGDTDKTPAKKREEKLF